MCKRRIDSLTRSKAVRISLLCCGCLVLFFILCFAIINGIVIGSTSKSIITVEDACALEDVDCIIILGAGLKRDGTPSDMLRDRLDVGISLYQGGLEVPYLMSGDHQTEDYNEVGAMEYYVLDQGMPQTILYLDPSGLSTYDSLWRLKQCENIEKIVIVTQKYHLYRALYIADSLGFSAYGVDASLNSYFGQTYRDLREVLARGKDFFLCLFQSDATITENCPEIP